MEYLIKRKTERPALKAIVFDFDGTISTLRRGWEDIMKPFMIEMISGNTDAGDDIIREVDGYIKESTGIQTIHQMKWLAEAVQRYGLNQSAPKDPWWYKKEYNDRLMEPVNRRKKEISSGSKLPEDFLIKGSIKLLEALRSKGVSMYLASGTDEPDVKEEANVLGLDEYFVKIDGAPPGKIDCSKEAVLRMLIEENKLMGPEVAVIGDGKVEIALGREVGAATLGVASNEEKRCGVDSQKRERLIKAGAHAIVGDFLEHDEILNWLGTGSR